MVNILTVKNLNYMSLFKDVSFAFKENEFHLITGSNKCGKTTLIRLLSGVYEIESAIFYKQRDLTALKSFEFRSLFGRVFYQGDVSFTFSNLDQEILYRLDQLELSPSEKKMKYKNLVQLFELKDYLTIGFDQYSSYQKIKALILLELVHTPKILLLDQVFIDLSEEESKKLISILKRIGGITVIASAQDLELSLEFDSLFVFDQAKLILNGSPLEVLKDDSKLNKIGLNLPFMVDLSTKLKYYDLVNDTILDMDRMVNELWK